jgi:hypothetical protein
MEDIDLMATSVPIRLTFQRMLKGENERIKRMDGKRLEKLRERGFRLNWELKEGEGEVGFVGFLTERLASGTGEFYYIIALNWP